MVRRFRFSFWILVSIMLSSCASPIGLRLGWIDDPIVYQPSRVMEDDLQTLALVAHEEANFNSADGTKLHGWYCPVENPKAVVLFAHGNAGNLSDRVPLLRAWTKQLGVTVMIFDYRGYGKSEGTPSEQGLLADARAARKWLATRANIAESEIVLYGRSLGGGVMVDLAAKDGAKALVLESTFTSLPDVANDAFPITPVGFLMRNKFRSIDKIGTYRGPLWIAHGNVDKVIPFEHGQKLFEAANEPKEFVPIAGAGHNTPPSNAYLKLLRVFFENLGEEREEELSKL